MDQSLSQYSKTLKKPHNLGSKKGTEKRTLTRKLNLKIVKSFRHNLPTMEAQATPTRLNEQFMDVLEQIHTIMISQGEGFRARAYKNAIETISMYPGDIIDVSQLEGQRGIGKTILAKLTEYVETGTLQLLDREKNNPLNTFTQIYGVGPKKAKMLIASGITTLDQLEQVATRELNDKQQIGLKYYHDILERIPRSEIEEYSILLSEIFKKTMPDGSYFEIVGSYRRGNTTSGDIDIILTDSNNNQTILTQFINVLTQHGLILEELSHGTIKSMTIMQLPTTESVPSPRPRRVDFMYSPPDEYAFAVLYFTGSKYFNTAMRQHALTLGYTLNEHGLSHMHNKIKGNRLSTAFPNEKSIFNFLNLEYKNPHERIDARSLVLAPNTTPKTLVEAAPKKIKLRIKKVSPAIKQISEFKTHGISYLHTLTEPQLSTIIEYANNAYYNKTQVMTDNEFDIIKEFIETNYPDNIAIQKIGADLISNLQHTQTSHNKVTLPYPMPSMNKIKPDTAALGTWEQTHSGPYVLSAKLDGVSAIYTTETSQPSLYTRGNGTVGQDISHMIPYLYLPTTSGVTLRGELIIPKEVFEKKYKNEFANPRNMVAGVVNKQTIDAEKYADIHFIAYEVIHPELKPSDQFILLNNLNVEVVRYDPGATVSNDELSGLLINWRENYEYEIDGIIITDDNIYSRTAKNPKHSIAFKMVLSDQVAEAKVVDVLWSASKHGYLKPRIQIEPIIIGGAEIQYATAFNAAFIVNNNIGVGSVVRLVRSGDVIPHIQEVIVQSSQPKMPTVPYMWTDTHVDIMLENAATDQVVQEKAITAFFRKLEVEGLGAGNITRIMSAGFTTLPQILHMSIDDFLTVDGFKDRLATKIHNNIQEALHDVSLPVLMAATNIFGRGMGERRITPILEQYPNVLTDNTSDEEKIQRIAAMHGMGGKTAPLFVSHITEFLEFLQTAGLESKLSVVATDAATDAATDTATDADDPLYQKRIVMTGFRDKKLEDHIKERGGILASDVSSKTFAVIVKNLDESTGKADKARKLDVPIVLFVDFISVFVPNY
jgi:DNA ligase (NAD+)